MIDTGPVTKLEQEPEPHGATFERGEDHHLAGAGEPDDGSPVPIADVVTGPSGAVSMPRDREVDN